MMMRVILLLGRYIGVAIAISNVAECSEGRNRIGRSEMSIIKDLLRWRLSLNSNVAASVGRYLEAGVQSVPVSE